jgi:hypothetical protein
MERYVGLDAHAETCTFAVVGPSGRRLISRVVETNGKALIETLQSFPGRLHLCLEEGTQSAWLNEILSPHVAECRWRRGTGPQSRGRMGPSRDVGVAARSGPGGGVGLIV